MRRLLFVLLIIGIIPLVVQAQETTPEAQANTCPTLITEAFTATGLICEGLVAGQACVGNGNVQSTPRSGVEDFSFAQPGDRVSISDIQSLRLRTQGTDNTVWAVTQFQLQAPTNNNAIANVTLLLFGDVALTEDSAPPVESSVRSATVRAAGGMNVRREPNTTSPIIWQLGANEGVIAIGRSANNEWIRIIIPSQYQGPGWVYAPFMEVEGGAETLAFAAVTDEVPTVLPADRRALESFRFESSLADASCLDTPDSGILLQTPNGFPDNIQLQVNGVDIQLNGTAFLKAQRDGNLTLSVLEGEGSLDVSGTTITITNGFESTVPLNAEQSPTSVPTATTPFDPATYATLPINLLPRFFTIRGADTGATTTQPAASTNEQPVPPAATEEAPGG